MIRSSPSNQYSTVARVSNEYPITPAVVNASSGATEWLRIARVTNFVDAEFASLRATMHLSGML